MSISNILTHAVAGAVGYALAGASERANDDNANGIEPVIAALRRHGHDATIVKPVLFDKGDTFEIAKRNTERFQAALDEAAQTPFSTVVHAVSDNAIFARVSDETRAKRMKVVGSSALTWHDAPANTYGVEKRRLIGAPLPCVEVPAGVFVCLSGTFRVASDHQTFIDVLDGSVVYGNYEAKPIITTARFVDLGGSFELPTTEPFSNKIYPDGYMPKADGTSGYALKGGDGKGFDWSTTTGTLPIDSFESSSFDSTALKGTGYEGNFPQMGANGKYGSATAKTWGYHNGLLGGTTSLVRMLGSDDVAYLHDVKIIGSCGNAVSCGLRHPVAIVSNHHISGVEMYRHYTGGVQIHISDHDRIDDCDIRATGDDGYTAYEVHTYAQAGYGVSCSRDGRQGVFKHTRLRIYDTRRRAWDSHGLREGEIEDSILHGCNFGISVGFTARNHVGDRAYDPFMGKRIAVRNCDIEGAYGVDCDNSDVFVDEVGQLIGHIFVDKASKISAYYGVKNIYPRAIFCSDGVTIVKSTKFQKLNGQQAQVGLWLGSVNESRGDFFTRLVAVVRTAEGGFPGKNHVIVEPHTVGIRVVTDSNFANVTVSADKFDDESWVKTATRTIVKPIEFNYTRVKYAQGTFDRAVFPDGTKDIVVLGSYNTREPYSEQSADAMIKLALYRLKNGKIKHDAAKYAVDNALIAVRTPGNNLQIDFLKVKE